MQCSSETDQPLNLEPHKCEGWASYSWDDLRNILAGERSGLSLFGPLKQLVQENPKSVLEFLG